MKQIGFNKPYFTGREIEYIVDAVKREKISGNGYYTQRCHEFLQNRYSLKKVLLTSSCTDALEMCALLIDIKEGDEVIVPSYTFVSTANAFILRGAKIIFADSRANHPNIDAEKIEKLITEKTRAIVVVHYAGIACDMDRIMQIASKHNLFVIEDAAQAIESTYKGRPLGSIGHLATLSFHETKNVISGEGGALLINDDRFTKRAEVLWEKGTNRSAFFRGEIDKYGWIDVGSSFLPSDITAAFLFAQLEAIETIQSKRHHLWNSYYQKLRHLGAKEVGLPLVPEADRHNAHIFYLICKTPEEQAKLLKFLNANGVNAIFHYLSLHRSPFYINKYQGPALVNCDRFQNTLVRLPLYFEMSDDDIEYVCKNVIAFYE